MCASVCISFCLSALRIFKSSYLLYFLFHSLFLSSPLDLFLHFFPGLFLFFFFLFTAWLCLAQPGSDLVHWFPEASFQEILRTLHYRRMRIILQEKTKLGQTCCNRRSNGMIMGVRIISLQVFAYTINLDNCPDQSLPDHTKYKESQHMKNQ